MNRILITCLACFDYCIDLMFRWEIEIKTWTHIFVFPALLVMFLVSFDCYLCNAKNKDYMYILFQLSYLAFRSVICSARFQLLDFVFKIFDVACRLLRSFLLLWLE